MTEYVVESLRVEIAASAPFVWDVLVDYPRYPEWNPYTVAVETTLVVGDPIDLTLPNPDGSSGTFVNREYIRVVDPPRLLRYDSAEELPGLFAVREQWIEDLGPDHCAYRTTDTLTGEHAAWVMAKTGEWVRAGFDSVARALRDRAEQLWAASRDAVPG